MVLRDQSARSSCTFRIRDRRRWIQERLEAEPRTFDTGEVLERLISSEIFEDVLHARYPGTKRFSLEGAIALIPLLDEVLTGVRPAGAAEIMLGMSHRGRLNVIVHIVGKDPADVFAGFEDAEPRTVLGGGDVKYHLGASGTYSTRDGIAAGATRLEPQPSRSRVPVVLGRARARQIRLGDRDHTRVLPVVLHGDGAFAARVSSRKRSTSPSSRVRCRRDDSHRREQFDRVHDRILENSTRRVLRRMWRSGCRFRSFMSTGRIVAAVLRAGQLAAAYRHVFKSDVVVDLIGYRRYGHSEVDDPTVTHPALYSRIKNHPPLSRDTEPSRRRRGATVEAVRTRRFMPHRRRLLRGPFVRHCPSPPSTGSPIAVGATESSTRSIRGVSMDRMQALGDR